MVPTRFRPLHIPGTGTAVPVFPFVNTTASTAITGAASATVTPASMKNIFLGDILSIAQGTGTPELVQVTATTSTTFTAFFANAHSGTYNIVSQKPGDLGPVEVNNAGSGTVLTLYNGNPALAGAWGTNGQTISVKTITATEVFYPPTGYLENQLYYTIAGSGFDITIWYLPHGA